MENHCTYRRFLRFGRSNVRLGVLVVGIESVRAAGALLVKLDRPVNRKIFEYVVARFPPHLVYHDDIPKAVNVCLPGAQICLKEKDLLQQSR
jgi:hypothetical protein